MRRIPSRATRPVKAVLALHVAALLAACEGGNERSVAVAVIGDEDAPFASGARLPYAARLVRAATAEGLVGFDEQGRLVPGIADRWTVTDDGESYIFRLRDGAWGAGVAPGEPTRAALVQAIGALRGTPLGLDLGGIDEIRVMAGRVLEIRLARPMPDLLLLLAQPELGLVRRGRGTGPMTLKRVGRTALLTAMPPESRGLPARENWKEDVRTVRLVGRDTGAAIADFAAGKVDFVLGGTFADFPRPGRLALTRNRPRFDPVTGLFGLKVTRATGLLATPAGREAIAKAIDRDALAAALAVPGWTGTTRLVAPGLEGDSGFVDERWTMQPIAVRQLEAAKVVAGWTKGRRTPVVLRVTLPVGAGADLLFGRLQTDLGVIGVRLQRVAPGADADLRLLDQVAHSARPAWFLGQLSCATDRAPCSEAADLLAERAATERDAKAAADLTAQAEAMLTKANTYIPLGSPVRWSLANGEGAGFATNRWGVHPLYELATAAVK